MPEPDTGKESKMQVKKFFTPKKLLAIFTAMTLVFIAILIVLGPKLFYGPIHIHLFASHGITTQDVVALVPFIGGTLWFAKEVWEGQYIVQDDIERFPVYSAKVMFGFGLLAGIYTGIPIAIILIRKFDIFCN
jgi:hypothetical protein